MNYSGKTIKSLVKTLDLYKIYESNQNFLVGVSYIYDVVYEEQRVKLCLLYKRPSDRKNAIGYDIDTIYMSKDFHL